MPCTQAYIISLNHLKYEITNLFDETSYSINSTTNFSYDLPYGLPKYKKGSSKTLKPLISLVRQEGFEPPTHGLEGRCSIQLSY